VNILPLALHSPRAVDEALRSLGWEPGRAGDAAGGIHPAAFLLSGLDAAAQLALVHHGGQLGLEVLTGDDWAIIAGSRARLGALARPWVVPEPLADLATCLGMALPPEPAVEWRTARGMLSLAEPVLVGILNVTPDSFSDGGRFNSLDAAREHASRLVSEGASVIDVGGESTRPGRTSIVPVEEELRRVVPVIEALVADNPSLIISVDTVKAAVARAALDAGAAIVNDVSGLRLDPAMADAVAQAKAGVVLMHSRGDLLAIASYAHAQYTGGVARDVITELAAAIATALAAGIAPDGIVLDPGLGFSKTVPQNLLLLDQLSALLSLGRPIMIGPSRKRFLGTADSVTAVACALGWERGARLFRVHDVAAARAALSLARSLDHS
jgi:dihydropteroate synthase